MAGHIILDFDGEETERLLIIALKKEYPDLLKNAGITDPEITELGYKGMYIAQREQKEEE